MRPKRRQWRQNEQVPRERPPPQPPGRPMNAAKAPAAGFYVARGPAPDIDGGPLHGAVVAIGNFDGVHRGHRAVIGAARRRAETLGRKTAALTFTPHPRLFLRPQDTLFQLSSERDKLRLLGRHRARRRHRDEFRCRAWPRPRRRISSRAFWSAAWASAARPSASISISARIAPARRHFSPSRAPGLALRSTSCRRWRTRAARCRRARCARRWPPAGWWRRPSSWARPGSSPARSSMARSADASSAFPPPISSSIRPAGSSTASMRCASAVGGKRFDGVASFGVRPMFDDGAPLLEVFLFDFAGDLYGQHDRRRLHRLDPPRAEIRIDRGAASAP